MKPPKPRILQFFIAIVFALAGTARAWAAASQIIFISASNPMSYDTPGDGSGSAGTTQLYSIPTRDTWADYEAATTDAPFTGLEAAWSPVATTSFDWSYATLDGISSVAQDWDQAEFSAPARAGGNYEFVISCDILITRGGIVQIAETPTYNVNLMCIDVGSLT